MHSLPQDDNALVQSIFAATQQLAERGALNENTLRILVEQGRGLDPALWEPIIIGTPEGAPRSLLLRVMAESATGPDRDRLRFAADLEARAEADPFLRVLRLAESARLRSSAAPVELLDELDSLTESYQRVELLRAFAGSEVRPDIAQRLAEVAFALPEEWNRIAALEAIADLFGPYLWERILFNVRAAPTAEERAAGLITYARVAPADERDALLREALDAFESEPVTPAGQWQRAPRIARLGALTTPQHAGLRADLERIAEALPEPEARFEAFCGVLEQAAGRDPGWPALVRRARQAAGEAPYPHVRASLLARLVAVAPEAEQEKLHRQMLAAAQAFARTTTNPHDQAMGLIDIAERVPVWRRGGFLRLAPLINAEPNRASFLCWLAYSGPEEEWERIARAAAALTETEPAARVYATLATLPDCPAEQRQLWLAQAAEAVDRIVNPDARTSVRLALAACAHLLVWGATSEPERLAEQIVSLWWRALALSFLAQFQAPIPALITLAQAQQVAATIPNEDQRRSGEGLAEHVNASQDDGYAAAWGAPLPPQLESLLRALESGVQPEMGLDPGEAALPGTPSPAPGQLRPARERLVNTGFATDERPEQPHNPMLPLRAGALYYFWLEVGPLVGGAADVNPQALPAEHLPQAALLQVVLFSINERISLSPGASVGELSLQADGRAVVERQPTGDSPPPLPDGDLLKRRLLFPVRMPAAAGTYALRCNIYCRGTLVQSRSVRVKVQHRPRPSKTPAVTVTADYTLSHSLAGPALSATAPPRLSLFLNNNGDGTHTFFAHAAGGKINRSASFDGAALQDMVTNARNAYRTASWGSSAPFNASDQTHPYRYGGPPDLATLARDLKMLAVQGYSMYDVIMDALEGDSDEEMQEVEDLQAALRPPGVVHIAVKDSPRFILPAALIYDAPLDTALNLEGPGGLRLCPVFEDTFTRGLPLEESACFDPARGCPNHDNLRIVCPSGFWGFRHSLGMPTSTEGEGISQIRFNGQPRVVVGVSTDPFFTLRAAHETRLQGLRPGGLDWKYAATRDQVLNLLKSESPHLIYFYCHGVITRSDRRGIEVGPKDSALILPDTFRLFRIDWRQSHPLVFINGCGTGAVEPEQAYDMVGKLLRKVAASGVIGTEITIFETLARDFAEGCLSLFLAGKPIGEAVQRTRLSLLAAGNPLGLVYIPFLLPDLRLVEA